MAAPPRPRAATADERVFAAEAALRCQGLPRPWRSRTLAANNTAANPKARQAPDRAAALASAPAPVRAAHMCRRIDDSQT